MRRSTGTPVGPVLPFSYVRPPRAGFGTYRARRTRAENMIMWLKGVTMFKRLSMIVMMIALCLAALAVEERHGILVGVVIKAGLRGENGGHQAG